MSAASPLMPLHPPVHALMLLVNMLGGLAILVTGGGVVTFGLGLLYLALFTPVSYICWFRAIYKAFRCASYFNDQFDIIIM